MEIELQNTDSKKYGPKFREHLFEQYKLYLQGIENISDRRQNANNYFIAINTALISLIGLSIQYKIFNNLSWIKAMVALVGILICIIFWFLIRSYKQLNTGKFNVLHKIEGLLPLTLYKYEWTVLKEGKDRKVYYPFSHIELLIPWAFGIIYIILFLFLLGGVSDQGELTPPSIKLNSTTMTTPSPQPCGRDDRFIETKGSTDEELNTILFGDEEAIRFVKDNCLGVFKSLKANISSSDKEDLIFWGSGIGCGSCHAQTLYMFSEGKKIYEMGLDDPQVKVVKRNGKLDMVEITTPVRSNNEGMCCPTWGLRTDYEWFTYDNTSSLLQVSQVPVKYN